MMVARDDDQVARERASLGHGVFTYYLLQSLTRTRQGEDVVSVSRLYEEVMRAVQADTKGLQVPVLNGRIAGTKFPCLD